MDEVWRPALALALLLYEETLKLMNAKLGSDHPNTLVTTNSLPATHWQAKQLDKSIPLFEEALKRQEAKPRRDHPNTLVTMANLGVNYRDAGRLQDAMPLLEEAYRSWKKYAVLEGWAADCPTFMRRQVRTPSSPIGSGNNCPNFGKRFPGTACN